MTDKADEHVNGNGKLNRIALIVSIAAFLIGGGGIVNLYREAGAREEKLIRLERELDRLRDETMPRKELEANFEALRKQVTSANDKIDRWFYSQRDPGRP